MTPLVTINLNSAIDKIIEIEDFTLGMTAKAKSFYFYPAGKANNAAKTISCMKEEVSAFGFVGENDYSFFKNMETNYLNMQLIPVDGNTRTNIPIIDGQRRLILHTRTSGYSIDDEDISSLLHALREVRQSGAIITLSGSLPLEAPEDSFNRIIEFCNSSGAKVILDTNGSSLKNALRAKPFLIKPNLEEFQDLLDTELISDPDIVSAAKLINNTGVEYVLVSNGPEGVILCRRGFKGYWKAAVELDEEEIKGESVGCGDAMVAGLAVSVKHEHDIGAMLQTAVACGAANLLRVGPGICDLEDINRLRQKVIVQYFDV